MLPRPAVMRHEEAVVQGKKPKTGAGLPEKKLAGLFFLSLSFFFKEFIYFFLERGEGIGTGREPSMCGCVSHAPYWGPGLQPRHVP